MRQIKVLLVAIVLAGCRGSRDRPFEQLVVRSLAPNANLEIVTTVDDSGHVDALHAVLETGVVMVNPRKVGTPLYRFEFMRRRGENASYDFVPHERGHTTLLVRRDGMLYSVEIRRIRAWCAASRFPFDKYIKAPEPTRNTR